MTVSDRSGAARILVIRGGAMGDFVLTLPVLAALRAQFPQCRLDLVAYPQFGELAVAGDLVDSLRPIESRPLAGFFALGGDLDREWGSYFGSCGLILSYLYDPDRIFERNVLRCSRAQFIACPHRPDEGGDQHATLVFLRPLERLTIFDADPVPRLRLAGLAEDEGLDGGRGMVALHPGSGSERKNWPESNWRRLMEEILVGDGWRIYLVGGEAEGDRLDRLARGLPESRVRVARNLPLVELGRGLSQCKAYVGHDSGITHLAAALGLPGLVLWGPSKEAIWRPRSDRMTLLRAEEGLLGLSISTVVEGLAHLLSSLEDGEDVD